MNAIQYSINTVIHSIPRTILDMVFVNEMYVNTTLEDKIYNRVIKSRVIPDLNVTGGIMITIPLAQCNVVSMTDRYSVYNIPSNLRDNKPIMTVLSMIMVQPYMIEPYESLLEATMAQNKLRNQGLPIHSSSEIEVLGDDTVMVHEYINNPSAYSLRLVVANDPYLNNLHPRFYPDLSKLVVLAVKAYIYNHMEMNLDKGFIVSGHKLDNVQRIVDKYENANEEYMELLTTKWHKLQFMNRTNSMERCVKWMIPTNI